MYGSRAGNNMLAMAKKILDVLCSIWKGKIIRLTTDGASSMKGCQFDIFIQDGLKSCSCNLRRHKLFRM
jgi:hypothetical protein